MKSQNTTYILANWKSNKTKSEAIHWLTIFLDLYKPHPNQRIIIAPPLLYLEPLKNILDKSGTTGVSLAAQDISPFPSGSYTGEVTASMLGEFVDYVMVGHSERRKYFHESNGDIARKIEEAQSASITPILCLDMDYASAQIAALDQNSLDHDLIIGYGPVEAVNLEIPQDPEDQQNNILAIQKRVPNLPILYGGSVRPDNAKSYLNLKSISGLMVGSSCLDPKEFAKICKYNDEPVHTY